VEDSGSVQAFYRAALEGLHMLEARRGSARWFGADADARWKVLEGDLSAADRLDVVLRDADAQFFGAVGARGVFARVGVAVDDAFGFGWPGLAARQAERLLREVLAEPPASTCEELRRRVRAAWASAGASSAGASSAGKGDAATPPEAAPTWDLRPAERILVAGPTMVAALGDRFRGRTDLDWADQVTVLATPPEHRQFAGLVAALAHVSRAPAILAASALPELDAATTVRTSPDVADEDRRALGGPHPEAPAGDSARAPSARSRA
jgi:hypothetical protein